MKNREIYSMELFDEVELGPASSFVRVPGGWIYREIDEQAGGWTTAVAFIPYDREFNYLEE